jgi:hypothetical protein
VQAVEFGKLGPRKAAASSGENAVGEGTSWEEPFSGVFGFAAGDSDRFRSFAKARGGQAKKRSALGSDVEALAFGRHGSDRLRSVAKVLAGRGWKRRASARRQSSRLGSDSSVAAAWFPAFSEGGRKLKRGDFGLAFELSRGSGPAKTLKSSACAKDKRGAANPIQRLARSD